MADKKQPPGSILVGRKLANGASTRTALLSVLPVISKDPDSKSDIQICLIILF